MDERYAILRQQLDRFSQSGQTFDLRHYITYCIVDILGSLAFGQSFDNQTDEDPAKIPPVSEFLYASCVTGQVPWAAGMLNFIRDYLPLSLVRELLAARARIGKLAMTGVRARKAKSSERDDILGKIMAVREEKTGQPMTEEQALTEAVTLIVGGTHTTGNSIHLLFANLFRNPAYLKSVVAELDQRPALQTGQAAYAFTGLEESLDIMNLAIKESFRKDPVGTFPMPRTVPVQGGSVAGFEVPSGVSCYPSMLEVELDSRSRC